jgi:hypothetical protein
MVSAGVIEPELSSQFKIKRFDLFLSRLLWHARTLGIAGYGYVIVPCPIEMTIFSHTNFCRSRALVSQPYNIVLYGGVSATRTQTDAFLRCLKMSFQGILI